MKNVSEMFKKIVKNSQAGFGMVQALMTVAAVGGGIYLVTQVSTQSKKSAESTKKLSDVSDLNINLLSNVKNLLIDSVNSKGMRTGGICELVRTDARDSVLANVYMLLPNFDKELFLEQRWDKYFEGFVVVDTNKCDKKIYTDNGLDVPKLGYRKCLKVDITSDVFGVGLSKNLSEKYDPYIEINIQPVYTNPLESNPFIAFEPNKSRELKTVKKGEKGEQVKYDVKAIGFQYTITSNYITTADKKYNEETEEFDYTYKRRSRNLEGFTWSGEAGICDIIDKDGNTKEVALTATGPGTTNKDIILNYAGFTEDSKATNGQEPLEVIMNSDEVQSGKLIGQGGRIITSDTDTLVYASCNERFFKCRQLTENDQKREYDSMSLPMKINYVEPNKISSNRGEMSFSPSISFRRTSGAIEIVDVDYKGEGDNIVSSDKKKFEYNLEFDDKPYQLFENGRFYNVYYTPITLSDAKDLVTVDISKVREILEADVVDKVKARKIRRSVPLLFKRSDERVIADARILRAGESKLADEQLIQIDDLEFAISFQKRKKAVITELTASASHELIYTLRDAISEDSAPSATETCRAICTAGNQYNKGSDPIHPYFKYTINLENNLDKDGEEIQTEYMRAQAPVACTSCYMKSCQRFGLGTFGPMNQMPNEPTDAGLPECVRFEQAASAQAEDDNINLGSSNANKCVAMKLKSGDLAGFEYIAVDCFSDKNVMCFNYGKHMLAEDIVGSGKTLVSAQFNNARNICFNTSKELVSTDSLTALFDQQGFDIDDENPSSVSPNNAAFAGLAKEFMAIGTVSTASDLLADFRVFRSGSLPAGTSPTLQGPVRRLITAPVPEGRNISSTIERAEIGFFNLANQGSFFAPVGDNQEQALRDYNEENNQITSQEFWVGLLTDNLGYIYSPAPTIPDQALNDANKWSLRYNENGIMVAEKHDVELDLQAGTGRQVGLLYHHVRYKGVAFANEENPIIHTEGEGDSATTENVALRFLCRKNNGEMVISTDTSANAQDGVSACNGVDAHFLPPTTTGQWEASFQLVHKNAGNAAFPLRSIASAKDYAPAWVAVEKGVGIGIYGTSNFDKFLEGDVVWRLKKDGSFFDNASDNVDVKLCLQESTGSFSVQTSCNSTGYRFLTSDELEAIKDEKNIILKTNLIVALSKLGNDDNKIQVMEAPSP